MDKKSDHEQKLDAYLESVRNQQRNVLWPDVPKNGRSVDELLWKGRSDAPLVQRIGIVILALAYLLVALSFASIAFKEGSWFAGIFSALLFGIGAWFIRNALKK